MEKNFPLGVIELRDPPGRRSLTALFYEFRQNCRSAEEKTNGGETSGMEGRNSEIMNDETNGIRINITDSKQQKWNDSLTASVLV